ncbi:hypothetical protein CPB86DRAFT_712841 [Serendipita vermifera]|nr:hypothetical protein CPB86DRAFT_712841 [Serendipita vermifera]
MIRRPLNEVLRRPFLQHSIRIHPVVCAKRARFFSNNSQDNKPSASPPVVVEKLKEWQSTAKDRSLKQLNTFIQATEKNLSLLGGKLNEVTGYELVEELKRKVIEQEARIEAARKASKEAKLAYESAVSERSACQREVNELLQRKSLWTETDVLRFTNLVRQDHLNEQAEAKAKVEAAATDQAIEQEFQNLTRAILNRYHEEQVWSDKIRSASTYGSLLALALNILIFILAIIVVEPYKRKRLAETFEKRIEELSLETKSLVNSLAVEINNHIDKQEVLLSAFKLPEEPSQENIPHGPVPIQQSLLETIEKRELVAAGCGAAVALFLGGLILSFAK